MLCAVFVKRCTADVLRKPVEVDDTEIDGMFFTLIIS